MARPVTIRSDDPSHPEQVNHHTRRKYNFNLEKFSLYQNSLQFGTAVRLNRQGHALRSEKIENVTKKLGCHDRGKDYQEIRISSLSTERYENGEREKEAIQVNLRCGILAGTK